MQRWLALALAAGGGARTGLFSVDASSADSGTERDADAAPADPEVCNGVDDDGDGLIDEDIVETTCGTGACRRTVPGCAHGRVPYCVAGAPRVEVCGGGDNDCDGFVDEGLAVGPIGGPFDLRIDEGSTGDCEVCRWAFNPHLWIHDDGMLVVWTLGYSGAHLAPNTYARVLDSGGVPIGEPVVLFEEPITPVLTAAVASGGENTLFLAFGQHAAGRDGNDLAGALVDTSGHVLLGPTILSEGNVGGLDAASAGEHLLLSWLSPTFDRPDVSLAVLDRDLQRAWTQIVDGGNSPGPVRLFWSGGWGLMAFTTRPPDSLIALTFVGLDAEGRPHGEPHVAPALESPGADHDSAPVIVPAEDGALAIGKTWWGPGRYVLAVNREGTPGEPRLTHDPLDWTYDALQVVPWGDGYVLTAQVSLPGEYGAPIVATLDRDGEMVDWRPLDPAADFWPADLVAHGDRVFVAYTSGDFDSRASVPNRVQLLELGCVE